ncbi:MAG: hypothetical protein H6736_22695 [Alphaproteobacteria bacterium]|nr:hypothetical protein [Alphaproteobacteria bacterium]MCB9694629.1 hypothetical protein [Alphaproteobacteria bacterium]
MTAVLASGHQLAGRRPWACDRCGASWLAVEPGPCRLCGDGQLAESDVLVNGEPEAVVRFAIDPQEAARRLEAYVAGTPMADPDARAAAGRLVPHHVPAWLVDARLVARFEAEVGFDYDVESTVETCSNGRWTTRPVTETRIRWEPRAGTLERAFDNEASPALSTWNAWLEVLAVPDPIVGGRLKDDHPILLPDRPPELAWPAAARGFKKRAGAVVQEAAAAAHVREVYIQPVWEDVVWTWVLFPVYSATWTDASGRKRVLRVDGRTGRVTGAVGSSRRLGWIWAAVWATLGLVVLGVSAVSVLPAIVFPVVLLLTFAGGALGFVLLVAAIVPPLRVYRVNRALPDVDPCVAHAAG